MEKVQTRIRELTDHWGARLPSPMTRLFTAEEFPNIYPCKFLSVEDILCDVANWPGKLPQFQPIGHDEDENLYGLFVRPNQPHPFGPVLWWNHEYDHYLPVASSFEEFLRYLLVQGPYLAQDDDDAPALTPDFAEKWINALGLSGSELRESAPPNRQKLAERLVKMDGQNAAALMELGCQFHGRNNHQHALDLWTRASEAAPWFADPHYLMAETYILGDNRKQAAAQWWNVLNMPIAMSSRTGNYDLGIARIDEEIYLASAVRCVDHAGYLPDGAIESSLFSLLAEGDAESPPARIELARELLVDSDTAGVERELLNALTLAISEDDTDAAYVGLIDLYTRLGRHQEADFCRRDWSSEG